MSFNRLCSIIFFFIRGDINTYIEISMRVKKLSKYQINPESCSSISPNCYIENHFDFSATEKYKNCDLLGDRVEYGKTQS